jgi:hypothetical protein
MFRPEVAIIWFPSKYVRVVGVVLLVHSTPTNISIYILPLLQKLHEQTGVCCYRDLFISTPSRSID